jgi:hypothetical protein
MRFAALGRHHVTVPGRTATLLAELGHPDLMQPLRGQRPCVCALRCRVRPKDGRMTTVEKATASLNECIVGDRYLHTRRVMLHCRWQGLVRPPNAAFACERDAIVAELQ